MQIDLAGIRAGSGSAVTTGPAAFDRLAELAAVALDAPMALVNFVDVDRQRLAGCVGLPEPYATSRELPADQNYRLLALALDGAVLVGDLASAFADSPVRQVFGAVAYAGVPLAAVDGSAVGTLCVMDRRPRKWTDRNQSVLEGLAATVMTELEMGRERDRRARLVEAFEDAPIGILLLDGPDHVLTYANAMLRQMLGPRPLGRPVRETLPDQARLEDYLDRVYVTGETVRAEAERALYDADLDGVDEEHFLSFAFTAIGGPGSRTGVLVSAVEVTDTVHVRQELERQRGRLAALDAMSVAASDSVDPRQALAALAAAAVPTVSDACAVYLLDHPVPPDAVRAGPIEVSRIAFAAAPGLARVLAPVSGLRFAGDDPLSRAARSRAPVMATVPSQGSAAWSRIARLGDFHASAGVHTVVAVPVFASGTLVAVIVFVGCGGRRRYGAGDISLMRTIADRAGGSVEHSTLVRRASETSLALQHSLLSAPTSPEHLPVVARYRPAPGQAEVGGDWYDSFLLPDAGLGLVIGDVVGHDLAATAAMGQLRNMLRSVACYTGDTPGAVLAAVDELAVRLSITHFATALLARVDGPPGGPHRLRWSNAGHPPPLLVVPGREALTLDGGNGPPLGLGLDLAVGRAEATYPLPPGSTVLLYTDGLVETRTDPLDERTAALGELLGRMPALDLESLCDVALAFNESGTDDTALLAVRIPGLAG
ncbi:MAG: SpoIIE family protein phosphatase [Acidimicrobiales bacterium]